MLGHAARAHLVAASWLVRLSDYKLNRELQNASTAFLSGFRRLIDERWLRMFSEDELQQALNGWLTPQLIRAHAAGQVISGSSSGSLNVDVAGQQSFHAPKKP